MEKKIYLSRPYKKFKFIASEKKKTKQKKI
jgi:hypothetical protein